MGYPVRAAARARVVRAAAAASPPALTTGYEALTPVVVSDSHDRSLIDLRIAICHTCSDRSILDLGMACGAQRVLVDLLNAALCPERV